MKTINLSFLLPIFDVNPFKKYAVLLVMFFGFSTLSACGGGGGSSDDTSKDQGTHLSQFAFLVADNPQLSQDLYMQLNPDSLSYTGRIVSNVAVNDLVASFKHDGSSVTVNGTVQTSAISKNDFTQITTYTVKADDSREQSYSIDLTKFTGLPIVYITIDDQAPIDSKDDYVHGDVIIDGGRSGLGLAISSMKIRGRGNSTWDHPKKPYQMKLSEKSEFLGMPTEKKWLFLAEYSDKTMLRNTIAFEMGHMSSLKWTPKSEFAEVYINNEYNGTYNITEKLEESDNRIALGDTGYLFEIDQPERLDYDDVFFRTGKFLVNIKEPELEFGSSEFNYAEDLINDFEEALFSADFKDPELGYAKYINVDSFIDWYLISEITKNVDSQFFSSIYFNVIPGEKINMGPLWDFDLSFGNVDYADSRYAEGWWIKYNPWYAQLFKDPAFVAKVQQRFTFFRNNQSVILDKIDAYEQQLNWAQRENDKKWQTIGIYVWPNPVVFDTYREEVEHLKTWYVNRMNWLNSALNSL